ncbi:hypothetical protein V2J09_009296 [Rumex salicifolius]
MKISYPGGFDGEPEIEIGQEVLEVMAGLWKNCIYVKVLSRSVPLPVLERKLRDLWKPMGGMNVDLPRRFFMVRFESDVDYFAALTSGPWKLFGSYLLIKAWDPNLDPTTDDIATTLWVRIANIPMVYYHKAILMGIAAGFGKPIRRGRFAPVCVEINLSRPLKGSITKTVQGLNSICSFCGIYGHMITNCPKEKASTVA